MWDFGDPAATERRLRAAILVGERAGDDEYAGIVRTQLAHAQGLQRHFDDAYATLDASEERLADASTELRMRDLLERGRVLNSSGSPEQAPALFEQAWELGQDAQLDALTADAGHMLAIALPRVRPARATSRRSTLSACWRWDAPTKRARDSPWRTRGLARTSGCRPKSPSASRA